MDEKLALRFEHEGSPMRVVSFARAEGIVFDKPKDASPLNLALGLQPLFPGRLDPVRLRHDWRREEFSLDARVEDNALVLSGFDGDREGLPFGPYDVTVEVESYRFKNSQKRVVIDRGERKEITLQVKPDNRRVKLTGTFDSPTQTLIDKSTVDGHAAEAWLESGTPREARKACLLNILTRLAARPMPGSTVKSLTPRLRSVHFADVDRVYALADPGLRSDLESFVAKKGWRSEGKPTSPVHGKVVKDALKRFKTELLGRKVEDFTLSSFRQGGRNCLQIVIAEPNFTHDRVYVDIDIDLGNPLWNIEGFLVHMGELLDPARTDHSDLHKKLNKGETGDFVFYEIV